MQRGRRSAGDSPFAYSGSSRARDGSTKETMPVSSGDESAFSSDRVVTGSSCGGWQYGGLSYMYGGCFDQWIPYLWACPPHDGLSVADGPTLFFYTSNYSKAYLLSPVHCLHLQNWFHQLQLFFQTQIHSSLQVQPFSLHFQLQFS